MNRTAAGPRTAGRPLSRNGHIDRAEGLLEARGQLVHAIAGVTDAVRALNASDTHLRALRDLMDAAA